MLELELHFPHFLKNEERDRAQEAAILAGRSDVSGGSGSASPEVSARFKLFRETAKITKNRFDCLTSKLLTAAQTIKHREYTCTEGNRWKITNNVCGPYPSPDP